MLIGSDGKSDSEHPTPLGTLEEVGKAQRVSSRGKSCLEGPVQHAGVNDEPADRDEGLVSGLDVTSTSVAWGSDGPSFGA